MRTAFVNTSSTGKLTPQGGFGLIEIIVSLLILAIGILGVASTQTVSVQTNSQSQMRSQAVLLSEDLFDRIRANSVNKGAYALADGPAVGADGGDCLTSFAPDSGNLTQDDVATWENSLACLLPQAEREVVVNGDTITITIDWDQNDQDFAMDPIVIRTEI